jgi:hypothetical protein
MEAITAAPASYMPSAPAKDWAIGGGYMTRTLSQIECAEPSHGRSDEYPVGDAR